MEARGRPTGRGRIQCAMSIKRISETCQEFLGLRYWLCGFYFQRKGIRLHRVVWEHYRGSIPEGQHVHHRDGNRANNDLSNLELIDQSAHLRYHGKTGDRSKWSEAMREGAKRWHASEEGRAWHSRHAR